ncbi:MAG: efflux RND transporter periplasmic adaptor subunit [Pseudomonadota bacterium]
MNRRFSTLLFLLGAVPTLLMAQDAEPVIRPALVANVEASDGVLRRSYSALVYPSREAELSFRVSGQVVELPVRGAMTVAEGDVIAALDKRDFETSVAQAQQQVQQAEAQLEALRVGARAEEVAVLEANVAAAEAQVDQAREQTERTRELAERGVATTAQLDQEETNLRVAEANLLVQAEQLAIGVAGGRPEDIASAEASLEALRLQLAVAEDSLSDTTLRAPFNGVIARRDIDNFALVTAGQSIALLHALATVDLVFDIPGPDVVAFTQIDPDDVDTQVAFDAVPGVMLTGDLVEFSTQADAATQTYRGRIAVEVPEGATILPGMIGRVIVSAQVGGDTTVTVPLAAIGAAPDGRPQVWVVDTATNAVSARDVELGEASGDRVAVLSGLEESDTVIAAGVSKMQEGMVVRPITEIGG